MRPRWSVGGVASGDYEMAAVASDVYDAAMGLRSAHDGSGDPWPDEKTEAVLVALEARLAAWKPSRWPSRHAGDAGLRAFVQGCIDEVKVRRAGTFAGAALDCPADCDCRGFA